MTFNPSGSEFQLAVKEFLLETRENLEQVEYDLVELERCAPQEAGGSEAARRTFRVLHSLKGSCSFLGYPKLEELAHLGEDLLARVRDGTLAIGATVITAILSVLDAIREILGHIERENAEGERDYSNLTQHLTRMCDSDEIEPPGPAILPGPPLAAPPVCGPDRAPVQPVRAETPSPPPPPPRTPPPGRSPVPHPFPQRPAARSLQASLDLSQPGSLRAEAGGSDDQGLQGSDSGGPVTRAVENPPAGDRKLDATLRVDLKVLDRIMALAGELVLTRNQILQNNPTGDDRADPLFRQLNAITSELQGCIMQSRMRPIATIWKQLPRVVRDVALGSFKQVRLEMDGSETELDKTIIDALRDPLVHVLRNSVDHGIELPELRVALGKPAEGTILLRAYHAGGQISIEVADDGAGIDAREIRRAALENGLVPPADLARMSDQNLLPLIFLPGFSTASTVTRLSGRGVGLDVVKDHVEKLGGTIDVQSTLGKGTTFSLRIPLTLAIIQAILVKAGEDRYALPLARVVELIRLDGSAGRGAIETTHGVTGFRYRGRWLPVVRLDRLLGRDDEGPASEVVHLVVLKAIGRHFGLIVDQVIDSLEIVVKPLWQPLRGIAVYAGATQLADGTVALILDPLGLARRAGLLPETHQSVPTEPRPAGARAGVEQPVPRVLLAQGPRIGRVALPADRLTRIEDVPLARITTIEDRALLEQEGRILRLIDVAALLATAAAPALPCPGRDGERTHVAIYAHQGKAVGLIVGQVLDIVDHTSEVRGDPTRPHVQFTTLIDGRVVEFLDVEGLIRAAEPGFFNEPTAVAVAVAVAAGA